MTRAPAVACVTFLFHVVAAAQEPATCTFDTAGHLRSYTVTLGLAPGWRMNLGAARKIPPDYLTAAQAIQIHFQPPARVRLPLWARTVPGGDTTAMSSSSDRAGFGLDGHVRFRLADDGHLRDPLIEVGNASPDLMEAIAAAIRRADSAGHFAPPTKDVRKDKGTIILHFVDADDAKGPHVPLIRIHIPAIALDSGPEMLDMPRINYPEDARRASISDRVVLRLVVGADGRPDTSTVEIIQAGYRDFARAVMRAIPGARFRPARVAGCPLPVIVNLPIDFKIRTR